MHSGHHLLDLFLWFLQLNCLLENIRPTLLGITTQHVTPYDFLHQVDSSIYQKFFGKELFSTYFDENTLARTKRFGELDINIMVQAMHNNTVITSGALHLLQTSFSRRSWPELPEDTYRSNGRVRHENLNVQVGIVDPFVKTRK